MHCDLARGDFEIFVRTNFIVCCKKTRWTFP